MEPSPRAATPSRTPYPTAATGCETNWKPSASAVPMSIVKMPRSRSEMRSARKPQSVLANAPEMANMLTAATPIASLSPSSA